MTRYHAIGIEVTGNFEQITKLDGLVALDARDRRFAFQIAFDKLVNDGLTEIVLVIEDIVGKATFSATRLAS